jgi:hypothetical protein
MFERLIRIAFAFAVAFVFAGRMEAAAQHCARLALETKTEAPKAEAAAETMSCHHGGDEMAQKTEAPVKHHDRSGERCDCVGVLKGFSEIGSAMQSAHIEPYEWARPEAAAFASIEPSPALRPPRA